MWDETRVLSIGTHHKLQAATLVSRENQKLFLQTRTQITQPWVWEWEGERVREWERERERETFWLRHPLINIAQTNPHTTSTSTSTSTAHTTFHCNTLHNDVIVMRHNVRNRECSIFPRYLWGCLGYQTQTASQGCQGNCIHRSCSSERWLFLTWWQTDRKG